MVNLVNSTQNGSLKEGESTIIAANLDLANGIGNLSGATVKITGNFNANQDQLGISGQTGTTGTIGAIQWTYNDTSGTLTFTGNASEAAYEAALRQVTYTNTSGTGSKAVQVSVSKVGLDTERNAFYEYVGADEGITWDAAKTGAESKTFLGSTGFLATITSAAEQAFVNSLLDGNAWIGASDATEEGVWRWVTGPETGTQFWQGDGTTGNATQGSFANWLGQEPNNANNDDYALLAGPSTFQEIGTWYDETINGGGGGFASQGYLVDYGTGFVNNSSFSLTVNAAIPQPTVVTSIFNFKRFSQISGFAGRSIVSQPLVVGGLETDLFYDETYYLQNNADVRSAVQNGTFSSGYEHFKQFGWLEGRDFTSVFDEDFYLAANADVAQAVASGALKSGFQHFALSGHKELRDPSSLFRQQDYLTQYADVKSGVTAGAIGSAFEHWTEFGADELRGPQLMLFQEGFYLQQYADVKAAVQNGQISSGYEHYIKFGALEGRNPSSSFNESTYLELNSDVKAAVQAGGFPNGLSHYVLFGRFEGRSVGLD